MSHRRRLPIEQGIYRDGNHLVARVRVGSKYSDELDRRQTFPLGTDLDTIRAWRAYALGDLLQTRPVGPSSGSLAADVPAFLETIEAGMRKDGFTYLLKDWADSPLGAIDRHQITRVDILTQRSQWLDQGMAIVTANHHLRALRALYTGLDGPDVPHPTDKIKNLRVPKREPRAIPIPYVEQILEALPDHGRAERFGTRPPYSELKIRLRVIAWTGMPPIQLQRLRPRDVDLKAGRLYLKPRQKGKGAPAVWVGLLPQATDALADFARVGLWGNAWSRSSMAKSWRGAIRRVQAQYNDEAIATNDWTAAHAFRDAIPPKCRPYDLRHSFATEIYRITGDVGATAELLQHANLETTMGYTGGAVSERVSLAIAKMAQAHKVPARLRIVAGKD